MVAKDGHQDGCKRFSRQEETAGCPELGLERAGMHLDGSRGRELQAVRPRLRLPELSFRQGDERSVGSTAGAVSGER